jgi:metal-responsive CopG/Arc/MetJ family transcriptional regulator
MATLTVDDDVLLKVDELAKEEEISREDFVNRAIRVYLHEKLMDDLNAHGRRLGLTEEIISEEIKRSREERRQANA